MNAWMQLVRIQTPELMMQWGGKLKHPQPTPPRVVSSDPTFQRSVVPHKEIVRAVEARRKAVLELLYKQPNLTSEEMSVILGAGYSQVNNDTIELRKRGLVMRAVAPTRGVASRYKLGDERRGKKGIPTT